MANRGRFFLLYLIGGTLTLLLLFNDNVWNGAMLGSYSINLQGRFEWLGHRNISQDVNGKGAGKKGGAKPGPIPDITNKTVILIWTTYYQVPVLKIIPVILSQESIYPGCCSTDNVLLTSDKRLLPNATAVVFFNYYADFNKRNIPRTRSPNQLWVLFGKEGPIYSRVDLGQFSDMFNWTMTYRRDSDIWSPYGLAVPLKPPVPKNKEIIMPGEIPLSQWVASKTEMMAGVISRCSSHSKRGTFVKALQNASLPVHIYGPCGSYRICGRHDGKCNHTKLWMDLGAKYKFYFTAENSFCEDYITEKFWRTLQNGMVPLVYGGGNYAAEAPPNSFIDVRQFKSVKEIVDHLNNIGNDPKKYSKYFEWRRKYEVKLPDCWGGWCKLCKLARQHHKKLGKMEVSPNKSYKDLKSWWMKAGKGSDKDACSPPPVLL